MDYGRGVVILMVNWDVAKWPTICATDQCVCHHLRHHLRYVAAGFSHCIVASNGSGEIGVDDDNGVFAWGNAMHRELGLQPKPMARQNRPRRINPANFSDQKIVTLAGADEYSVVLSETRRIWVFGDYSIMKISPDVEVTPQPDFHDANILQWQVPDKLDRFRRLRSPPHEIYMYINIYINI